MAEGERPRDEAPGGGAQGGRRRRRRRSSSTKAGGRSGKPRSGGSVEGAPSAKVKDPSSRRRKPKRQAAARAGITATTRKKPARRKRAASKRKGATERRKGTTERRKAAPTKREISAGGVVYRRAGDVIEIVLASRRTRRGELAWGLAKGGIEDGESMEDAAVREVREETGLNAEIESSLGETRYFYVWEDVRIRKTVHFFLMRHTGGDIEDRDDEMEEIRWFPLERALKRAAYRGERDVLQRAAEQLR